MIHGLKNAIIAILALGIWIFGPHLLLSIFSVKARALFLNRAFWGAILGVTIPWIAGLGIFMLGFSLAVKYGKAPGEGGIAALWFIFGGLAAIWISTGLIFFSKWVPQDFSQALMTGMYWSGILIIAPVLVAALVAFIIGSIMYIRNQA